MRSWQNGAVRIHVLGARGSTPSPGREFVRYGGHTSCLALARGGEEPHLIIDAGTGIKQRPARYYRGPFLGAVLLGHLHWDHTQGLPFFAKGDMQGSEVALYAPAHVDEAGEQIDMKGLLSRAMSPPHFPITPAGLNGSWSFAGLDEGESQIAGFSVLALEVPHKGGRTFGYRVSDGRHTVAYLSDRCPTRSAQGRAAWGVPRGRSASCP